MGLHYVALIPAKGTSVGVPRKNFQEVGGKTLLARTVEAALSVDRISRTVVSTENADIAEYAENLGVEVHFRGASAASADAAAAEVVQDFLVGNTNGVVAGLKTVVYLQPTSPFRTQHHINAALDLFEREGSGSLISVCQVKQIPEKMLLRKDQRVRVDSSRVRGHGTNRQDLPKRLYPNGAIYVFSEQEFFMHQEVPIDGAAFFEMDELSSFDIDSLADLEIAKAVAAHVGI